LRFQTAEQYFLGEAGDTNWRFTGWLARKHNHDGALEPLSSLALAARTTPTDASCSSLFAVPLFMPTNKALVLKKQRSEWDDPVFEVVLFVGPPSCGKTHLWKTTTCASCVPFPLAVLVAGCEEEARAQTSADSAARLLLSLLCPQTSTDPVKLQHLLERDSPTSIVVDASLPTRTGRRALIRLVEKFSPEHRVRAFVWNVDEDLAKHNHVFSWLYGDSGGGEKPAWLGEEDWRSWFAKYETVNFEESASTFSLSLLLSSSSSTPS